MATLRVHPAHVGRNRQDVLGEGLQYRCPSVRSGGFRLFADRYFL